MSNEDYGMSPQGGGGELSSDDKLLSALSYWLAIVTSFIAPLIIFFIKKDESPFIKKHALQATLLSVVLFVVELLGSMLTFGLAWFPIFGLKAIYLLFLGYKTFQGEDVAIPVVTDMVNKN